MLNNGESQLSLENAVIVQPLPSRYTQKQDNFT